MTNRTQKTIKDLEKLDKALRVFADSWAIPEDYIILDQPSPEQSVRIMKLAKSIESTIKEIGIF
jgi:hypothetical protein